MQPSVKCNTTVREKKKSAALHLQVIPTSGPFYCYTDL